MIFGQKMKLIIITIIKHHNSKHYIRSIFINTYDDYPVCIKNTALKYPGCWPNIFDRSSLTTVIVYTEERLQRMGLSLNGSCHFCNENETLLHLFVHCKFVDSVWIEVFDKFNDFFLRKFNILAEKSEKIYV